MLIYYKTTCQNCRQTDGQKSIHHVFGNGVDPELWKEKTEYHVKNELEKWRKRDGLVCQFCNSPYVEAYDIYIDDYKLFDLERTRSVYRYEDLYIFIIEKSEGNIRYQNSSNERVNLNFVEACHDKMLNMVKELPICFYKKHQRGNFYFCFTSNKWEESEEGELILHKHYADGITKDEVVHCLNNVLSVMKEKYK